MSNFNTKKTFRLIVEGVEFSIKSTATKAQAMTDLIFDVGGSALCDKTYTLSAEQFAEFGKRSVDILKN